MRYSFLAGRKRSANKTGSSGALARSGPRAPARELMSPKSQFETSHARATLAEQRRAYDRARYARRKAGKGAGACG
jgi:hypothetical protein